jgi:toxin ParE1/3/4
MRVIWSETAISQLIEIQRYIEQDKPEAARKSAQRILAYVERLVKHPYLGRPGREPETRELLIPEAPYIIPYRVDRGRIAILAVLHDARKSPEKSK